MIKWIKQFISNLEANRTVRHVELVAIEQQLAAHALVIQSIDRQSTDELRKEVKQLKDLVETLSRRLVGFSKTGIS